MTFHQSRTVDGICGLVLPEILSIDQAREHADLDFVVDEGAIEVRGPEYARLTPDEALRVGAFLTAWGVHLKAQETRTP